MTNFAERTKGAISADAGISIGDNVWIIQGAGAPTNGASGTGVGFAGPGSLYIDRTNANLYQNTNTKASPTWTQNGD